MALGKSKQYIFPSMRLNGHDTQLSFNKTLHYTFML